MARLLIVGATGLVGKIVMELALADERVSRVIALTRRPIASSDKLENVVIDFSDMPEQAAWWSVDGVVSALGTTRATAKSRSAYRRSITTTRLPSRVMHVTTARHALRSPRHWEQILARASSTHARRVNWNSN